MTAGRREHEAVIEAATTPLALAECTNMSRTFGAGRTAVLAVCDVSCRIAPSARIAVTGPSGSGKSTLLHLIAGLDAPTAGSVEWPAFPDGSNRHPTAIGMVFQGPSLLPGLDVTENVALPLLFAGQSDETATCLARATLELVGISELAAKLPDELSGGQAQRVAIARVLAARPALILADEPTGQLDHRHADGVITVLLDTAASIDAAVIIATHDPAVAARLPDHWVMSDGHLDAHRNTDRPTP